MNINENLSIDDQKSKHELKFVVDNITKKFIDCITKLEYIGKLQIIKMDESFPCTKKGTKGSIEWDYP